jgi:hypothetical protein
MKIFLYIALFSFIIDVSMNNKNYKNCIAASANADNAKTVPTHFVYVVLFFHHFIWLFALFGWLSNNKNILKVYLIVVFIYLLHWKKNNNKCFVTEWIRENCNLSQKYGLQAITNFFGLSVSGRENQKKLLFAYFMIALFKLLN